MDLEEALGSAFARLGGETLEGRALAEREVTALLRSAAQEQSAFARALGLLRFRAGTGASDPGGPALEARRRLSVILGSDDRLLGFAAELSVGAAGSERDVGLGAIAAQLDRWSRTVTVEPQYAAYDAPRQAIEFPRELLDRAAFRIALDPNGRAFGPMDGASAFDRLDRTGGAPIPIVLDPLFVERTVRRPSPRLGAARIEGPWHEILEALCTIHDGAFQLQGFRFEGEIDPRQMESGNAAFDGEAEGDNSDSLERAPVRPWIHVVAQGTTENAPLGRDLREVGGTRIASWCGDVLREGNLIRQRAAARALAALDWPAALHWLERRWLWYGDVTAFEGLMGAAARGRVVSSLQRERWLRAALGLVDEESRRVEALGAALDVAIAPETVAAARAAYESAALALNGRALRIALGLRELSPVLLSGSIEAPEVRPLGPVLTAEPTGGGAQWTELGLWLRLAVAEGATQGDDGLERFARGALASSREPSVRRQAIRTLVAVQGGDPGRDPVAQGGEAPKGPVLDRVEELFLRTETRPDIRGLGMELGLLAVQRGLRARFRPAVPTSALLQDPEVLTELVVWAAFRAEVGRAAGERPPRWVVAVVQAAVQESRQALAASNPDVRVVRRSAWMTAASDLRGAGGNLLGGLADWVTPTGSPAGSPGSAARALESLALWAGSPSPSAPSEVIMRRAEEDLSKRSTDPDAVERAWLDLAALTGDGLLGARARAALQSSLGEALVQRSGGPSARLSMVVLAAEEAVRAMEGARLDAESEAFQNALRTTATRADHPLAQRFYQVDWPPTDEVPARDLERIEPVMPPSIRR